MCIETLTCSIPYHFTNDHVFPKQISELMVFSPSYEDKTLAFKKVKQM